MQKVRIADLTIHMNTVDVDFFNERLRAYRDDDAGEPDLCITFKAPADIPSPNVPMVECNERTRYAMLPDGRSFRGLYDTKSGRLLQTIVCTPDYAEAEVCVPRDRRHRSLTLTDFEYMFTGLVFGDRLAYLGGLVLHGSAIAFDGNGIIFSAPPGTGKSTHTGLWCEQYGERVVIVNDDKPAIRFDDVGCPVIYGTPWSGKTDLNNNVSAPLRAIVFLARQPINTIRRLSPTEAMLYISRELPMPFHDTALGEQLWNTTTKLLESVPVYLLGCTVSTEAVTLVKKTLNL